MNFAQVKSISPAEPIADLPITLVQKCSRWGTVIDGMALAMVGLAFALPAGLFTAEAIAANSATDPFLMQRPGSALLTVFGLFLMFIPVACLFRRVLLGLSGDCEIMLTNQDVTVKRKTLTGRKNWTRPLSDFEGLTHYVRTTLSTPRHELILVHPDSKRSLLLRIDHAINETETQQLADTLKLPVIAPTHLFKFPRLSPFPA